MVLVQSSYFHLSYNIEVLPFPLENILFHNCTIQEGHHFRLISEQYSSSSLFLWLVSIFSWPEQKGIVLMMELEIHTMGIFLYIFPPYFPMQVAAPYGRKMKYSKLIKSKCKCLGKNSRILSLA